MANRETNMIAVVMQIPGLLLQAAAIAALLFLTYGAPIPTLFAIAASLIWLEIPRYQYADQVGSWRAARDLYVKVGEWLDRDDAGETFDDALARRMKVYDGIEHEGMDGLALGQNVGNGVRAVFKFAVQVYLIAVIVGIIGERVDGLL